MDLSGKRYGYLTVTSLEGRKNYRNMWVCKCDCGNTVTFADYILKANRQHYCSRSCRLRNDLTGKRFNRLTVLRLVSHKPRKWECRCDCGNIVQVASGDLVSGHTKSCGCYKHEVFKAHRDKHMNSNTKLYFIWEGMKQRCNNPRNKSYKSYGGRGIKYHPDWEKFETFLKWSTSVGYEEGLSLERIDVNGNYEPSNCKFISLGQQSDNTRKTVRFTIQGETKTLKEWCVIYNKSLPMVRTRLRRGWGIVDALEKDKIPHIENLRFKRDKSEGR